MLNVGDLSLSIGFVDIANFFCGTERRTCHLKEDKCRPRREQKREQRPTPQRAIHRPASCDSDQQTENQINDRTDRWVHRERVLLFKCSPDQCVALRQNLKSDPQPPGSASPQQRISVSVKRGMSTRDGRLLVSTRLLGIVFWWHGT